MKSALYVGRVSGGISRGEDKSGLNGTGLLNRRANSGQCARQHGAIAERSQDADINAQRDKHMWDLVSYLIWVMVLIGVGFALVFGIKAYLSGTLPFVSMLAAGSERRLDVIDQANVDGKRRLLLVRRDNVEHLIMTGGPVDIVIETGIGAIATSVPNLTRATTVSEAQSKGDVSEPVFSRPPRTFSKAIGEN